MLLGPCDRCVAIDFGTSHFCGLGQVRDVFSWIKGKANGGCDGTIKPTTKTAIGEVLFGNHINRLLVERGKVFRVLRKSGGGARIVRQHGFAIAVPVYVPVKSRQE